jgi:hypothetical protein
MGVHGGGKIATAERAATKRLRDTEAGRRIQDLGDAVSLDQLKEAAAAPCPSPKLSPRPNV